MRGPGDLDLLAGGVGGVVAAEHQDLVGVLVVGDQELLVPVQREQGEEVVVVPELTGLRGGGLLLRVEGGGAAEYGLAPADDDVLAIAAGDGHGVGGVGRDGSETQTARHGGVGGMGGVRVMGGAGGGFRALGADDVRGGPRRGGHGDDGGGTHHGTATEGAGDHIAEVLVGAGVGNLVEAGVTTPETAGHRGPAARMRSGRRSDQRQQLAHFTLPMVSLYVPLVSA